MTLLLSRLDPKETVVLLKPFSDGFGTFFADIYIIGTTIVKHMIPNFVCPMFQCSVTGYCNLALQVVSSDKPFSFPISVKNELLTLFGFPCISILHAMNTDVDIDL